jgi:hypothetical protein
MVGRPAPTGKTGSDFDFPTFHAIERRPCRAA